VEPQNIEARVAALETQVRELAERVRASEQDAAAARVLAGAADRDVTEFRGQLRDFRQATVASFNALREDMRDLRADMNDRFARVDERFTRVDNGFIEIRGKLDAAAAGQRQIVELIQALIADQGENGGTGHC
jgi:chromosome segregation ATPase